MISSLLGIALASAVLVTIPGPNVGLIIANTLQYGLRSGLATVFGTSVGLLMQLAVVVMGLAALVETASGVLTWLRWAGVGYFLWLGIRAWRAPVESLDVEPLEPPVFWHGVVIAVLNPKTLLFIAAFLPQFIPASATTADVALVAAVYLAVLALGDCVWALSANSARRWLNRYARLRNRLTGGFLVAAAAGLALSRRAGEGFRPI
ncbi:MAG: LysE family translocator [Pseudomonadota bacterium]